MKYSPSLSRQGRHDDLLGNIVGRIKNVGVRAMEAEKRLHMSDILAFCLRGYPQ